MSENGIKPERTTVLSDGLNTKSKPCVANVVDIFLWIIFGTSNHLKVNYIDELDLNMRQLVALVRKALGQDKSIGLSIPFFFEFIEVYIFDLLTNITRRKFTICSIQILKFCSTTSLSSAHFSLKFRALNPLEEAQIKKIETEFINKKSNLIFSCE